MVTRLLAFLILLWLPTLAVPRGLHRLTALLASASLYIYVTHWLVYPLVDPAHKGVAVIAFLAAGTLYWVAATRSMGLAEKWLRKRQVPQLEYGRKPACAYEHPGQHRSRGRVV